MSKRLFAVVTSSTARSRALGFISLLAIVATGTHERVLAELSPQQVDIGPPQVPIPCPTDDRTVTDAQQLITALANPDFAGTILIPSGVTIQLGTTRNLPVRSCVRIKGTRNGLDPGALIVATGRDQEGAIFEVEGQYVLIQGLRFRGPVTTDDRSPGISVRALGIGGNASSVQIDNNVFEFWSVGVDVSRGWAGEWKADGCKEKASLISITRNYFNRNAVEKLGYGVGVFRGCAKIEANLFNKNRHAVAASGDISDSAGTWHGKGYVARYNYVLEGGFRVCDPGCYWNQHFDVHGTGSGGYGGTAGEYFVIAWNAIRGEQKSGVWPFTSTRPAFMLRGKAEYAAVFHDNVVVHDDPDEAVRLAAGTECIEFVAGYPRPSYDLCNLFVVSNRYNTDTINQLAVGDFDGDGRDDIFLANGTAWWYSSAGQTEWRFLLPSTLRVRDLRFGRFNRDARTDVLFSDGVNWWVSMGGTGLPRLLRTDGTRLIDCVFGDFTGDGVTDALRANGSTWSVSPGASEPWIDVQQYPVRAANLRVGDFTGDGVDDVFWIANNTWRLWDAGSNAWLQDEAMPVADTDMPLLLVADFDGDGQADLAKTVADGWTWLRTGSNMWAPLRGSGGQTEYSDIRSALLGRFTIGRRLDAIRYASSRFPNEYRYGFVIWNGTEDPFVRWTPAWQEMR